MASFSCDTSELDEIKRKSSSKNFVSDSITVKGVNMTKRFAEKEEEIYNLEVSEDDVWVCSFPKTGTTMTLEMVWMIMNKLDFEGGQEILEKRCPFLEFSQIFQTVKDFGAPEHIKDSIKYVKERRGKKCVKTHLPWTLLPREIQENIKKPKIIYVTRNPKDACLSFYYHCKLFGMYTGTLEDFCKLFLAGEIRYTPFWDHVIPFWERRNHPNILFLKYEEMIKDLSSTIRKVAQFLETDLTEEQIARLTEHLSFQSMKNNKAVNFSGLLKWLKENNLCSGEGSFIRSGKIGEANSKMSPEILQKFEKWTKENLKNKDF